MDKTVPEPIPGASPLPAMTSDPKAIEAFLLGKKSSGDIIVGTNTNGEAIADTDCGANGNTDSGFNDPNPTVNSSHEPSDCHSHTNAKDGDQSDSTTPAL